jgi:serine/threonine-protein kinase
VTWKPTRLDPELAAELTVERVELNRRRLLIIGSLMVVVHALHAWHFHVPTDQRGAASVVELRWRDALVLAHLVTLGFALAITLTARFVRTPVVLRVLGPITAIGYLAHGAIISGIDQIMVANMTAYVGYAFGIALLVALTRLEAAVAYTIGLTTLILGLRHYASADALGTNLPTSFTLTIVTLCLSWFTEGIRRRELTQRRTIARQQTELEALNTGLEKRVREQVEEIVARAADVERLNAELQAQVRARSTELSSALQRLARQMETEHGLEPGAVIADRFVVEKVIGEGGMGRVYAGTDRSTSSRVAIKVLQVSSSFQLDSLRRFIREAGATAAIQHPAVIRVLAFDVSDGGLLYQVQELIEGHTLARRLARGWAAGDTARLGAVLADALAAAHAQRVIHRDVKPDNIMLTTTAPGLKLLDFGIAKLLDAAHAEGATREIVVIGTPAYMAPEQVSGGDVTDRADIYALGVVLYRVLSGTLPVEGDGAHELMLRKLADEAPPIAGAPPDLAAAIQSCLLRAADRRPSAAELAVTLRTIADRLGAGSLEALTAREPIDTTASATAVERISR